MKKGLVMEGGAMKGMFTCGVIDVLMENGIAFDGAVGVSAGACFGCNYKSGQIGRAYRYNRKYCKDKRYAGFGNFLTTGNVFGVDFCYHTLPFELDIWDVEAFRKNPMEFYAVATDVETGYAAYHKCEDGLEKDLEWIRASASVPIASKIVEVDGRKLLDGGVADGIPLKFLEGLGYDRNVVITTKPIEFRRKKNKLLFALEKKVFKEYPEFVKAFERKEDIYNMQMEYLADKERRNEIVVIRPPQLLTIKTVERNPKKFDEVYALGREEANKRIEEVRAFLMN